MSERPLRAVDDAPAFVPRYVVVDAASGERLPRCPGCTERDATIADAVDENEGLIETTRSLASKLRKARRDKEAEMKDHALFPQALEAFDYWLVETGRTKRSRLDAKRFDLLEPFIKRDGLEMVKLAIDGAAYDPHRADRPGRNGKIEVYDGLETIFKNRGSFERHVKKAPVARLRAVRDTGGFGDTYTDADLRVKAEVILALEGGYELEGEALAMAAAAAVERAKLELEGRAKA